MLQAILGVLAAVGAALGTLKASGVNIGPIGNEALNIINSSTIDLANYNNGQAVVLGTFSEGGKPGTLLAVANGGPAAQSLGL